MLSDGAELEPKLLRLSGHVRTQLTEKQYALSYPALIVKARAQGLSSALNSDSAGKGQPVHMGQPAKQWEPPPTEAGTSPVLAGMFAPRGQQFGSVSFTEAWAVPTGRSAVREGHRVQLVTSHRGGLQSGSLGSWAKVHIPSRGLDTREYRCWATCRSSGSTWSTSGEPLSYQVRWAQVSCRSRVPPQPPSSHLCCTKTSSPAHPCCPQGVGPL